MQILVLIVWLVFLAAWSALLTGLINMYIIPKLMPDSTFTIHYLIVFIFLIFCYIMYAEFKNKDSDRFAKFRKKFNS